MCICNNSLSRKKKTLVSLPLVLSLKMVYNDIVQKRNEKPMAGSGLPGLGENRFVGESRQKGGKHEVFLH